MNYVKNMMVTSQPPPLQKNVPDGLSTVLTGLMPETLYHISVMVRGCRTKVIGPCSATTPVNLSIPSTETGQTVSLDEFVNNLEVFQNSLMDAEIDTRMLMIEVNKGFGWEPIEFDDIAKVTSNTTEVMFRARLGSGPWAVFAVSLTTPPTPFNWTVVSTYLILIVVVAVIALVVTGIFLLLKYIQTQRREKDKGENLCMLLLIVCARTHGSCTCICMHARTHARTHTHQASSTDTHTVHTYTHTYAATYTYVHVELPLTIDMIYLYKIALTS